MKQLFIPIPNTGIAWGHQTQRVFLDVKENDAYQTEVVRLEAKYGRVLSKKEMAHELGISLKVLTQRIHVGKGIPEYIENAAGRHIFPVSAVATYLSKGLIKTA